MQRLLLCCDTWSCPWTDREHPEGPLRRWSWNALDIRWIRAEGEFHRPLASLSCDRSRYRDSLDEEIRDWLNENGIRAVRRQNLHPYGNGAHASNPALLSEN